MVMDGLDAGSAAIYVGYESVTQFNREYSRMFGRPPLRDTRALRFYLRLAPSVVHAMDASHCSFPWLGNRPSVSSLSCCRYW
jgi:AraC-like DNA-binding protein